MAWTIHSWSPELGTGSIASPHFRPVPFEASANVDGVVDYRVGEPIEVELQGRAPAFRVLRIRPFVQRQPPRTHYPAFDVINGRFGDARFEERSEHRLVFWLGDCCEILHAQPNSASL